MKELIERQAAIDALMELDKKLRIFNWFKYAHTEYECRGIDDAIIVIENLPAVQPEQFRCQKCRYKDLPVCRMDGENE